MDESGGLNTLPACSNGFDDDGDQLVDLADLDCESALDDDETDRGNTGTTILPPIDTSRGVAGDPTSPVGA
jgi:hypothetical protein